MSSLSPRDAILKTKQYDLTHCVTARKRKLAELYNVTTFCAGNCATEHYGSGTLKTHHQQHSKDAFLEANDISFGRFFNLSTLPSVAPPILPSQTKSIGAQASDPVAHVGLSETVAADVRHQYDPSPQEYGGTTPRLHDKSVQANEVHSAHSSPPKLAGSIVLDETLDRNLVASIPTKPTSPQIGTESGSLKAPHEAATSSPSEPVGSVAPAIVDANGGPGATHSMPETLLLDQDAATLGSSIATVVQELNGKCTPCLSHVNVQESQSESENAKNTPIHSQGEEFLEGSSEGRDVRGVSARESLVSRHTGSAPLQVNHGDGQLFHDIAGQERTSINEEQLDNHANVQVAVPRNSAFPGVPSTPDEQLRLEEAQSIQMAVSTVAMFPHRQQKLEPKNTVIVESGSQHIGDEMDAAKASSPLASPTLDVVDEARNSIGAFREREKAGGSPLASQRDGRIPGMVRHLSKDVTLSQRPPMHINTDIPYTPGQVNPKFSTGVSSLSTAQRSTVSESPAPARPGPSLVRAPSPPERMTTRVSSGALRHKSVSEILGETPKITTYHGEKSSVDRSHRESFREDMHTPSSTSFNPSPDSSSFRYRLVELREREKERSKLSTVVFARQQHQNTTAELDQAQLGDGNPHLDSSWNQDYLLPLFVAQAAAPPQSLQPPLAALLASAHKTLSTENLLTEFHEQQDCRILRKIYQLQHANRWSLRQLERSCEPARPTTHWDVLLGHMKWMRTDFREERKWKITAAKILADWCAAWVSCGVEERRLLQVTFKRLPIRSQTDSTSMPTPDLVPSNEDDSSDAMDDDAPLALTKQPFAPATIFSYAPDDIVFSLDKTPASEKLLSELPLYQPSLDLESAVLSSTDFTPDRAWQTALVPLSKFAEGKLTTSDARTPRKKRRYDYKDADEQDGEFTTRVTDSHSGLTKDIIPPEQEDIALFNPENKHIRDRIHAGHAFRPPTDCSMPSQAFFETRHSSQWAAGEDDELRRLVKEYAFNWSLISSCLSTTSLFSSGAERRTPWECFERWVNHLEGLPSEMSKLAYFKAYSSRLQAAQRTLEQQYAQQAHNANAQQAPNRRRNALPIRVDRRKNNKHLALIHAMQKLAKKRETAMQKQQHVAGLAAMRKANETTQQKAPIRTPREFSILKHEREIKHKLYEQQLLHHQKVAYQQRAAQHHGQQQIASTGMQPARNQEAASAIGTTPVVTSALPNGQMIASVPGQSRSMPLPTRPPNSAQANGIPTAGTPIGTNGVPQAPMHSSMQGPTRMIPEAGGDSMRILQEASRVQQDQQRFLQRQHQHPQIHGHGHNISSPNMASQNNVGMPTNPQAMNTNGSPPVNGSGGPGPSGPINSPSMAPTSQPLTLSGGTVPLVAQIASQVKANHPLASPEQLSKMTNDALARYRNHPRAAMQAASGSNAALFANNSNVNLHQPPSHQGLTNGSNGGLINMYATILRNQPQSQQNRIANGSINGALPTSRSATPSVPPLSGSVQVGPAHSSPRLPHVQPAGGQ